MTLDAGNDPEHLSLEPNPEILHAELLMPAMMIYILTDGPFSGLPEPQTLDKTPIP